MKFTRCLLLLSILLAGLSACGGDPLLRDDYLGKRLLEPERMPGEVVRDKYGNPVLQSKSQSPAKSQPQETRSFWHFLKIW